LKAVFLTKRNVFYLNIAIGVVIILSTLFFVRDIISQYFEKQRTLRKTSAIQSRAALPKQKPQFTDYFPILKNNPFGFQSGEIKLLSAVSGAKDQKTDVVLVGTVAGPRELSYGIFRDSTGVQEVFRIGESVFGAGILHAVNKDKVVIKKGANTTEIPMEDVRVKEIKKQNPAGGPSGSQFAQKIGRGTYMVDQMRLQQAIANPGQMMTDARLKPNIVGGKQEEGFVLSEVKPGGIYNSLGLQDGDVLLRINDYDISNPERALQAFNALKGLDRVQIDLIRAGSRMTMTYQIK